MGRVCLILPVASSSALSLDLVARCRRGLEDAGHAVEVIAVLDPREPRPADPPDGGLRWVSATWSGLSHATVIGLGEAADAAEGEILVVLDPTQGYHPGDLSKLVEPIAGGKADLAVARRAGGTRADTGRAGRGRRLAAAGAGRITRPLLGASDLFAGLVAITPTLARAIRGSFHPVGSRFTVDLLFRCKGRRIEVPVRVEGPAAPRPLGVDDLRVVKRLADDRFGNASRLFQFCAVGASGMVVDLSCYAAFQLVLSRTRLAGRFVPIVGSPLDLAAAGAMAIAVALTWNFTLNRRLTFSDARGGSLARQYLTYAVSNAMGIALSFSLRLYLPAHVAFFQHHKLAAAVVGIVSATGISFSMSRWLVFTHRPTPIPGAPTRPGHRGEPAKVAQTTTAR